MMLSSPNQHKDTARLTWLSEILHERFGHRFALVKSSAGLSLCLPGDHGTILFDQLEENFFKSSSDIPCAHWDSRVEGWQSALDFPLPAPGVEQLPLPLIERHNDRHVVHYDILGLAYWMLARVEEIGRTDLDTHGRFPATSSHAFKCGYLERPVVDEWLHVLGQIIQRQWPGIKLKQHTFCMKVSHDVDSPSQYAFVSNNVLLRSMIGDIVKRKDVRALFTRPWVFLHTTYQLHPSDPANTFDWIMDASEQHGLKSAFYFISGCTDRKMDGNYDISHPAIRHLMRRIHERGHEIGLHPSYGTYRNPDLIKFEAERLRAACAEEGIKQSTWGGRMHYLRWEHPTTLRGWEMAGMSYDTSLGYADRPGFRCGTCYEYPAFDPVAFQSKKLRIRPLIAMECSVISDNYIGMGVGDAAFEKFESLKMACKYVRGSFTLLWHNDKLIDVRAKELYESLLC